jgi:hypothetical protein
MLTAAQKQYKQEKRAYALSLAQRSQGFVRKELAMTSTSGHEMVKKMTAEGVLHVVNERHENRYFATAEQANQWIRKGIGTPSRAIVLPSAKVQTKQLTGPIIIPAHVKTTICPGRTIDPRYQVSSLDGVERLFGPISMGRKPEVRAT